MPKAKGQPTKKLPLWRIWVGGGYGAWLVRATERGAEAMRAHKANWEHAVARKTLVPEDLEPEVLAYYPRTPDILKESGELLQRGEFKPAAPGASVGPAGGGP